MYSWLLFQDEKQLDSLDCASSALRTQIIRKYVKPDPILGSTEPLKYRFKRSIRSGDFDFLKDSLLCFVSKELADFLRGKINAEFLPVQIDSNGEGSREYELMHLLDHVAGLDLQKSDYLQRSEELGGGIREIRKLVLDDKLVNGKVAFVLTEIHGIFVRDDLCRVIESMGFHGLRFQPVAEATFGV